MQLRKKWLLTISGILTFFACTHQVLNPTGGNNNGNGNGNGSGNGNGNGNNNGDSLICFEEQILPLFQSNCAKSGCHDAGSHREDYVLDSYNTIISRGIIPGNSHDSKIYQAILSRKGEDDIMPPSPNPPLSQEQVDLIGQWIDQGAQNTTNCSSGCDTSTFTYSAAVRPILEVHCIGCHNNTTQNGGVNLSTYSGVQTVALNGKLTGSINFQPGYPQMPPGGQKISDCNITQIMKWINAGAPNN